MSIGRIQGNIAQATQELTVAAASLNFDFTLVKIEAPAEYRNIGHILNPSRVREAETGPIHMTATKLGRLFDEAWPETPNLIKAYGTRASEISKEVSESESERSNGGSHNWIRNEYGGIDATSIWAAATSSKAALPVHLLACIIARMWKHTEATSLWVEIVAERKRDMISKYDEGEPIPATVANVLHQEITRDHLSKWDASARAWLQTADKARQRQYKQFLLIAKNLSIAVHQENIPLYSNVMSVWKSALNATEGLISGKPHVVQSGPVLLGLSAWHIFPDMLVFDVPTGNMYVSMDDPLVKPGGVLSLGISDPALSEEQGIYWSLSLSHHRYYGEAVRRTRRLESDGSRLTFNELVLVCLGSLLRVWSIPKQGSDSSIKVLQKLKEVLPQETPTDGLRMDWQTVIDQPMKQYADNDKQALLAISLGRRRPKFLPPALTSGRKPLFGLLHLPNLLYILKSADRKVSLLRRIAGRVPGLDNSNSIILCAEHMPETDAMNCQYATIRPDNSNQTKHCSRKHRDRTFHRWIDVPPAFLDEYKQTIVSAMHDYKKTTKHYQRTQPLESKESAESFNETMQEALSRPRLSLRRQKSYSSRDDEKDSDQKNLHRNVTADAGSVEGSSVKEGNDQKRNIIDRDETQRKRPEEIDVCVSVPPEIEGEDRSPSDRHDPQLDAQANFKAAHKQALKDLEELCDIYLIQRERELPGERIEFQNLLEDKAPQWTFERFNDVVKSSSGSERFGSFFGRRAGVDFRDVNSSGDLKSSGEHAVVYTKGKGKASADLHSEVSDAPNVTLDDILWCFEYDMVDLERLQILLAEEPAFAFLEVLAAVGEIYREPTSGGATISCSIIDEPFDPPIFSRTLTRKDWIQAPSHIALNANSAVALIGYFETGHNVIESMKGKYNIIGLSGGDSIFVCTAILNDPDTTYPTYSFTRILGNTRKAGFSILTSPSELMVRRLDPTAWRVEAASFDGLRLDNFKQTSLHLSFTDWQAPVVQFQSVGQRDADINIVEAVVSVRDRGKWVADVDIYRALLSPRFGRLEMTEDCKLHPGGINEGNFSGEDQEEMISIETWDQVLDQVDGSAVVRCFDNWVARLAIVSVLCRHSQENERPVLVCSKRMCWKCHANHLTDGRDFTYVF